jgi:hypothetical protein
MAFKLVIVEALYSNKFKFDYKANILANDPGRTGVSSPGLMPTMKHKRRRLNSCPSIQHYVYMSTRSKQSATGGQDVAKKAAKAFWTADDEQALVEFLKKHKAEAGDGANFKQTTWVAAAADMAKHTSRGAPKNAKSCLTKWTRVRNPVNIHL